MKTSNSLDWQRHKKEIGSNGRNLWEWPGKWQTQSDQNGQSETWRSACSWLCLCLRLSDFHQMCPTTSESRSTSPLKNNEKTVTMDNESSECSGSRENLSVTYRRWHVATVATSSPTAIAYRFSHMLWRCKNNSPDYHSSKLVSK